MKKQTIIALAVIGVLLVATIGVTFAYFASNSQNDNAGINAETKELGSILLDGTKVFTSYDLLPGQMGVQEFTIEKNSDTGNGIYEIDLEATVPEEFRSDIEILLYKTTDSTSNNVTVNVADPTLEDEMIYQSDSLNITGTPELVYQGTLTENPQIILEQADFDVTTLEKTTYYLVYHYKNNGNQDDQQGKTFTGTISVRLIGEKMSFSDVVLACNDTAANCIKDNANLSNEIATDDPDSNARYIGADPSNYVSFTGELWRIIGVFNNIDNGSGTKETRLKIIRDEPYSTGMAWDTDGVNDWSQASLQEELNTTYLNSIQSPYKEMISNAKWNLGGRYSYTTALASDWYGYERGTTVYSGRPTEWIGQIGLMYLSDYGYATSGGSSVNRASCLAKELYDWNSVSDCYNNDWLYDSSNYQWTLTPSSGDSNGVFTVRSYVFYSFATDTYNAVSPALYLSSNVRISGGDGSKTNPFTLSI